MKKFLLFLSVLTMLSFGVTDIFASSIDYSTNQSAQYTRNPSRNAVTDDADAAFWNPAGTALLADGLWLEFGDQSVMKEYKMTDKTNNTEYKDTEPAYFVPNIFAVYKSGQWAGFLSVLPTAGGGMVKYDGAVMFGAGADALNATGAYIGTTLGGAYKINDMISASLGLRYVYAYNEFEIKNGSMTLLDSTITASGIGAIIGINIAATKEMNIGMRYETITKLEFERDTKTDLTGMFTDGEKYNRDLPATLAFGISYLVMPELTASISCNYYFITQADTAKDSEAVALEGYDDDYENGWDLMVGVDYKLNPQLILSCGYQYSKTGGNKDTYSDLDMTLDQNVYCIGGKYKINPELDLSLGFAYFQYKTGEATAQTFGGPVDAEYNKKAMDLGLAIQYKAM